MNHTTDKTGTHMGTYSQAETLTFTKGLSTVKHKTVIRDTLLRAEDDCSQDCLSAFIRLWHSLCFCEGEAADGDPRQMKGSADFRFQRMWAPQIIPHIKYSTSSDFCPCILSHLNSAYGRTWPRSLWQVFKVWDQTSWSIAGGQQQDVRRVPEPAELVSPPDSDKPTWTPPQRYRRYTG